MRKYKRFLDSQNIICLHDLPKLTNGGTCIIFFDVFDNFKADRT